MLKKFCKCGCGNIVKKRFSSGHNVRLFNPMKIHNVIVKFIGKKRPKHSKFMKENNPMKNSEVAMKSGISRIGIKRPDLSKRNKENKGHKHPRYGTTWKHKPETIEKLKGPRPNISGKNNPRYIDGRSKLRRPGMYGREWNKIRYLVYKRDKFTCQNCGINKVKLDVHHIIPWFKTKDNSMDNLIALCRKCHTKEDNKKGTRYGRKNEQTNYRMSN